MIKLENYEVVGWEHAIRGMRNPMNSWEKSDTGWVDESEVEDDSSFLDIDFEWGTKKVIGPNDHNLMMKLAKGGSVHAKYRRMITVYVDITAPLYWWKEFDTYKVGTVANSCSTMHKIHEKEFTIDDFSHEYLTEDSLIVIPNDSDGFDRWSSLDILNVTVRMLNELRYQYQNRKSGVTAIEEIEAMDFWHQMIQILPSSYNQKRTVMLNYEVLTNIYHSRKNHKLDEWCEFCKWIESLPYSEIITGEKESMNDV